MDFVFKRLNADLSEFNVVSITQREKKPESIFQKLQTGKYASIGEIQDLIALTVVVLHRREVQQAVEVVKTSGLVVIEEASRVIEATDFRYREPKLYLTPPSEYLDRNTDLIGITSEVQFTSAIQHALDMTTHDFDYKSKTYLWTNFRLVAQLRGMLELVDSIIDDIGQVSVPNNEVIEAPGRVRFASEILKVLSSTFSAEVMPPDHRRMADTVAAWCTAMSLSPEQLGALLAANGDLVAAQSIDPTSAVLGSLLREDSSLLIENFSGQLFISGELESRCSEASLVPAGRRVTLV